MNNKGIQDSDLVKILESCHLRYVLDREGGWTVVKEWKDVLSGGEKQRIAMARLFYHKPMYAILDECTSQVSIDVEGQMYTSAKEMNISLLTVSHRPSLWKFHDYVLQFDGNGHVQFTQLDMHHRMSLEQEREELRKKLSDIPTIENRYKELCRLLDTVTSTSSEGIKKSTTGAQ